MNKQITGLVTFKSDIRQVSHGNRAWKLFNFLIVNETGIFNVTAYHTDCERFFPLVQQNKAYVLGYQQARYADQRHTTSDFRITLNSGCYLREEPAEVSLPKFNFRSYATVKSLPHGQPIELIGAITSISEISSAQSGDGESKLTRREISIIDINRMRLTVAIFRESALQFAGRTGDVLIVRAVRAKTHGGIYVRPGDFVLVNPNIPEAREINNWFSILFDEFVETLSPIKSHQSELLLFPDGRLPCDKFSDFLLYKEHCVCQPGSDFVHTRDPETSLVRMLKGLNLAQFSIDICVYLFTLDEIAKFLVQLHQIFSITIRVICDAGRVREELNRSDKITSLRLAGIEVRERQFSPRDFRPLMHHKFVIIDKRSCFLGSFNWTNQAVRFNNESVIKTDDPNVVCPLIEEFDRLWEEFRP